MAVEELSLAVDRGDCFGLLGPNGAGKTTSLNIMTGFVEPTAGRALIDGHDTAVEMNEVRIECCFIFL